MAIQPYVIQQYLLNELYDSMLTGLIFSKMGTKLSALCHGFQWQVELNLSALALLGCGQSFIPGPGPTAAIPSDGELCKLSTAVLPLLCLFACLIAVGVGCTRSCFGPSYECFFDCMQSDAPTARDGTPLHILSYVSATGPPLLSETSSSNSSGPILLAPRLRLFAKTFLRASR